MEQLSFDPETLEIVEVPIETIIAQYPELVPEYPVPEETEE